MDESVSLTNIQEKQNNSKQFEKDINKNIETKKILNVDNCDFKNWRQKLNRYITNIQK